MNIVLQEPWSVERFLAWEDRQAAKHEFDGVRIIPMTGGSRAHQWIAFNTMRLLFEQLNRNDFDMIQAMRMDVGGSVRYPDIAVCGGRIQDRLRTLRDAIVVFEVISDETAATDKNQKRQDYAKLPSIKHYVIVEQDRMAATVLTYVAGHWQEMDVTSGDIKLPAVHLELSLDAIYGGVDIQAILEK